MNVGWHLAVDISLASVIGDKLSEVAMQLIEKIKNDQFFTEHYKQRHGFITY